MKTILSIITFIVFAASSYAEQNAELEKRVTELEKEIAELKATLSPILEKAKVEEIVTGQRTLARNRMRMDADIYTREELKEIEKLYQVANKNWNSDEGIVSLKKLVDQYDRANRTGCALLYLGQMSKGDDREAYLRQAIEDHSDCFYGDGVQVGAYARFYLAYHYQKLGKTEKADALFKVIKEQYPNAINHKGVLLSTIMKK